MCGSRFLRLAAVWDWLKEKQKENSNFEGLPQKGGPHFEIQKIYGPICGYGLVFI